jgi:hypothetical protein
MKNKLTSEHVEMIATVIAAVFILLIVLGIALFNKKVCVTEPLPEFEHCESCVTPAPTHTINKMFHLHTPRY